MAYQPAAARVHKDTGDHVGRALAYCSRVCHNRVAMFRISGDALEWALKHMETQGDTDIFPRPFEFEAIRHGWDDVKTYLMSEELDIWNRGSHRYCMSPKGRYAYRVADQLDPLDALLYAGVTYEIGQQLEEYRLPAGDGIVTSNRFRPTTDGVLFDPAFNWSLFMHRCKELADDRRVTHVVIADIADFFPRIYHHRIANALDAATKGSPQKRIIMKILSQWSGGNSYGIPVGSAVSRILAEVTIDDVDQHLKGEGTVFCRFADDYRLFCGSYRDAYEKLELLANVLHRDHGLSLQQRKTVIVSVDKFKDRYLASPSVEELNSLVAQFHDLLEKLGITDPYQAIDYDSLDPKQQEAVDELNLKQLLEEQLSAEEIDIGFMKFILRRLGQVDDADVVDDLLDKAEHCYPVLSQIVQYFGALRSLNRAARTKIAAKMINLIRDSTVGHLPYHRCWLLSLFSESADWNQKDQFVELYNTLGDSLSRRKLILALGRSQQDYWFRARKTAVMDLEPWLRRAFLAAASCLPTDERRFWYNSLRTRLDPLEKAVVEWAKANPF